MAATRLAAATPRSSGLTGGRSRFEDQSFPRFATSVPVFRLSRPVIFSSLVVCARRGKKTGPVAQNQARGKAKVSILIFFSSPLIYGLTDSLSTAGNFILSCNIFDNYSLEIIQIWISSGKKMDALISLASG